MIKVSKKRIIFIYFVTCSKNNNFIECNN